MLGLLVFFSVLIGGYGIWALAYRVSEADNGVLKAEVAWIISRYVEGTGPEDPLVEVYEGVWAKSSNYYGVEINGVTYYYQLLPHQSFDPLSRGVVDEDEVTIWAVIEDTPDFTIIIYSIRQQGNEAMRSG